jgi:hypothetical protein
VCTLLYAIARRFLRLFDASAHTRGNYHQTEIRLLESPSPTKGEICQRDISPPKGREGMGHRYRAADQSPGIDNDAPISRRPTLRRSRRAPSPGIGRGHSRQNRRTSRRQSTRSRNDSRNAASKRRDDMLSISVIRHSVDHADKMPAVEIRRRSGQVSRALLGSAGHRGFRECRHAVMQRTCKPQDRQRERSARSLA